MDRLHTTYLAFDCAHRTHCTRASTKRRHRHHARTIPKKLAFRPTNVVDINYPSIATSKTLPAYTCRSATSAGGHVRSDLPPIQHRPQTYPLIVWSKPLPTYPSRSDALAGGQVRR